jgi:hypothetical protein
VAVRYHSAEVDAVGVLFLDEGVVDYTFCLLVVCYVLYVGVWMNLLGAILRDLPFRTNRCMEFIRFINHLPRAWGVWCPAIAFGRLDGFGSPRQGSPDVAFTFGAVSLRP